METNNNSKPKRQRARKTDGKFEGNTAPNTAWEPVDLEPEDKPIKYQVKQKVEGTSQDSAGKYSRTKTKKIRPTFGNVFTTSS